MGIGRIKCAAFDVTDLEVGAAFWSEVTGLPVLESPFPGRYAYVGQPDPWTCELILHKVKTTKGEAANGAHLDLWVRDVDLAVSQIEAIGGRVKFGPIIYPRTGAYPDEEPSLDWVVMQDPFGNEFCLTYILTRPERDAVVAAAETGADDDALRLAAASARAGR